MFLYLLPPADVSQTVCPAVVAGSVTQAMRAFEAHPIPGDWMDVCETVNATQEFGERVPNREPGVPFLFAV